MASNVIDQNRVRQIGFLILIALLGVLLFNQLREFVPALLGAITLYVVTRKWNRRLTLRKKNPWKKGRAATLIMIVSLVVILIPLGVLVNMLSTKVSYAIEHSSELIAALKKVITNLENRFNIEIASDENMNKLGGMIANSLPRLLSATFNILGTIVFMYFILYFMLTNSKKMEEALYEYVPLKDENVKKIGKEVHTVTLSNAIGIPLIALLQGVVALIGYLIIGVKEPWFWFVVTCIAAMLPVVGAALGYVPIAIIFFANDDAVRGVIMLIYGFVIIGLTDNLLRLVLAKKLGDVHPLITIFGVLVGLKLFGFIGLVFGPLLISMFILLLKIYSNEFMTKQRELKGQHLEN